MPLAERLSSKFHICPRRGQSLSCGHYPLVYQPPEGVYLLNTVLTDPINLMDRNYNELALMLISTRVMYYDCGNNIIIPRGFIPGGREGGVSRGFDISHSLSRHSLAVTVYHVTIQTPNIIVVQFRSGTVTIQAVWICNQQYIFLKLR